MGEAIGGIGSAVGGIAGLLANRGGSDLNNAYNTYASLDPNVYKQTGIQGDQQTKAVQNQLLQQTLARARAGGLNASDVANVNNILGTAGQAAKQAQAGAMQNAQMMGTQQGNSGILGAMVAGQNAANNANQQGINAAHIANQAAIANTAQGAQQAGELRGQNIGVEQGNVERGMQLGEFNKKAELARAGGLTGAGGDVFNAGQTTAQNYAGIGGSLGNTAGGLWKKYLSGQGGGGGGGTYGNGYNDVPTG